MVLLSLFLRCFLFKSLRRLFCSFDLRQVNWNVVRVVWGTSSWSWGCSKQASCSSKLRSLAERKATSRLWIRCLCSKSSGTSHHSNSSLEASWSTTSNTEAKASSSLASCESLGTTANELGLFLSWHLVKSPDLSLLCLGLSQLLRHKLLSEHSALITHVFIIILAWLSRALDNSGVLVSLVKVELGVLLSVFIIIIVTVVNEFVWLWSLSKLVGSALHFQKFKFIII